MDCEKDNTYKTSDLYYAAYLKVAAVPFLGTERDNGKVLFLFQIPEGGLRDLKNQYFTRVARVPALTYADEIKVMKTLTFSQ